MGYPLKISEFTRLQLEITNFCNASCPSCERATTQKQLNDYHLDLTDLQKWLDFGSLKSLQKVHLCGNIDEPTLHPDLIDIVKWIPVTTWVATNGGAREDKFWTELGKLDCMVVFGIDGLSDTNHLYRRNVNWKKLERNFRTFIDAGGTAAWQFIVFEHNNHQIEEARALSLHEGFSHFFTVETTRNNPLPAPPFERTVTELNCKACGSPELWKSLYIDVQGRLWPCCWMGTHEKQVYEIMDESYLGNSLHYNTMEDILNDMFSDLPLSKFDVCNSHCRDNITDDFQWTNS